MFSKKKMTYWFASSLPYDRVEKRLSLRFLRSRSSIATTIIEKNGCKVNRVDLSVRVFLR